MSIDLLHINKINEIFSKNNWRTKSDSSKKFDRFCELLDNMDTPEQCELVLELTENYLWISQNEYTQKLVNIFNDIPTEKLKSTIYIIPILSSDHKIDKDIKSGDMISYLCKTEEFRDNLQPHFDNITLEFKRELLISDIAKINKNNANLFLVDDFLGSGHSVQKALSELSKSGVTNLQSISVIAIVGHIMCLDFLNSQKIALHVEHLVDKGISDNYKEPDLSNKKTIMQQIENSLPTMAAYSLGYEQCEALVTVARTPDNTFPIYWKEYTKNNKKYLPPFYRKS